MTVDAEVGAGVSDADGVAAEPDSVWCPAITSDMYVELFVTTGFFTDIATQLYS